jgi:hypothetical protein
MCSFMLYIDIHATPNNEEVGNNTRPLRAIQGANLGKRIQVAPDHSFQ